MTDPDPDDTIDRIDSDHYEPSPSTGPRETARVLDATAGADHTPPFSREVTHE